MRRFPRLIPRSVCSTPNVTRAVKRLLLRGATKAGGGVVPVCECQYHEHAYNELSPATAWDLTRSYTSLADGTTILSQAITITEDCCVQAVGTILALSSYDIADFELEKPLGTIVVEQEDETTTGDMALFHYSSWEVLSPGVYTFFLVNRSGAAREITYAQLKIVAFACTGPPCVCTHHADAYNQNSWIAEDHDLTARFNNVADGGTILSQAITITEDCCVLTVGTVLADLYLAWVFDLERPYGIVVADQETVISAGLNSIMMYHYASWEVLTPGIYTYFLVNRRGAITRIHGAQLKIIAVTCQ